MFCFKLDKTASIICRMLRTAVGDVRRHICTDGFFKIQRQMTVVKNKHCG
jgi:hypothetical protein